MATSFLAVLHTAPIDGVATRKVGCPKLKQLISDKPKERNNTPADQF